MIRTLQRWGNNVTVVTVFSDYNDIPAALPYPVLTENISRRGFLGTQWEICQILKKYQSQAEVFHLDGHFFLYGAGLYRRLGGRVPVSAFFNRELTCWPENRSTFFPLPAPSLRARFKKKIRWLVERYLGMPLANGIDWWSTISPQFQAKYEEFGLKKDQHTTIIGDPVDLSRIREQNGITVDTYPQRNRHPGPFKIFYSGRMAPAKGFDVLLTAFNQVRNKEDFRLLLGGSGPEEKYVRQMVADYKLEPYVTLLGWMNKEQLYQQHREADIFIQADWMIFGTSISLLYALAFCLPCIIPAESGMHWVAKNAALTFAYRDPSDLARKIEQLGADYALREKLSRAAFQRLQEADLQYENQIGKLSEGLKRLVL